MTYKGEFKAWPEGNYQYYARYDQDTEGAWKVWRTRYFGNDTVIENDIKCACLMAENEWGTVSVILIPQE